MHRRQITSATWILALCALLFLTACPDTTDPPPVDDPPTDGVLPCRDTETWAKGFQADACQMADGSPPPVTPVYWPDVCTPDLNGWLPSQSSFDQLSWRSFFYNSWPAQADGKPDAGKSLGVAEGGVFAPTVWEKYKNAEDLFGDGGASLTAADYSSPGPVPDGCDPDGPRVLSMTSKFPHGAIEAVGAVLAAGDGDDPLSSIDQAFRGPLYPQGPDPLMPVFYEIRINDVEYTAIVDAGAQNKSPAELNCTGKYEMPGCTPFSFPLESTEVKAAWKVLSDEEVSSGKFFHQDLQVKDPSTGTCSVEPMGLVGLHIARKVVHAVPVGDGGRKNTWAWATFEHNDNVPPVGSDGGGGTYSFFDPNCEPAVDAATCAAVKTPNADEAYQCCPNLYRYAKGTVPTDPTPDQVTRIDEAPTETQACDQVYAGLDMGVFDNYSLVTTQWPKASEGGQDIQPTPAHSRNTVIETYFVEWQNGSQVNTSSCLGCHSGNLAVDMSYLFLGNVGK